MGRETQGAARHRAGDNPGHCWRKGTELAAGCYWGWLNETIAEARFDLWQSQVASAAVQDVQLPPLLVGVSRGKDRQTGVKSRGLFGTVRA